MDNAVALVEAYLRLNGYFTVTEYPVILEARIGFKEATDLDILAFRFPGAGPPMFGGRPRGKKPDRPPMEHDAHQRADMIIGEVKEGVADINRSAWDPRVLRHVLTRFGCCGPQDVGDVVRDLLQGGEAQTRAGHHVRMVAFGSSVERPDRPFTTVRLGEVVAFLQDHLRQNWSAYAAAHFKDPALGYLALVEKALRAGRR